MNTPAKPGGRMTKGSQFAIGPWQRIDKSKTPAFSSLLIHDDVLGKLVAFEHSVSSMFRDIASWAL
jgi:hypothetical protein